MMNLIKNKKLNILFLAVFSLLLLLPHIASASSSAGTITIIIGKVDLLKPGTERAVPASAGQRLEVGDVLRTKSESKAELAMNDGSIIRAAQETRLEITEYMMEGGKRNKSSLRLLRGKIRAIVSDNATLEGNPGNFEVHTPTAVGGVRGTDFYVYYLGSSGILVTEGAVAVFSPAVGKYVMVTAGFATNVGQGQRPEIPPRQTTQSEIDRHDHDTDPGYEDSFNDSGVSYISQLVGELEPFERHLYVFAMLAQNDPPPSSPSDPPPSEPPPVDPPTPPADELPFPPPPPPPDTGNAHVPPPWQPDGPPGDPTPGAPAPTPPATPGPPVPAPGNSGLPFPPPIGAPHNSHHTPPPWTPGGPPGNPKPGGA